MKTGSRIFGVVFILIFLLYAGNSFFNGFSEVVGVLFTGAESWESRTASAEQTAFFNLTERYRLLESQGTLQRLIDDTQSGGLDVIATTDGSYVSEAKDVYSRSELMEYAKRMKEVEDELRSMSVRTDLIYITMPDDVMISQTEVKGGYPLWNQAELSEDFQYFLHGYGTDYIDAQSILDNTTISVDEYTYRTDSRITTKSSFVLAREIIRILNEEYDEDLPFEAYDTNDYHFDLYEDYMLGNLGMRTGASFTGLEDFTLIYPDFRTYFTYTDITGKRSEGRFEDVLLRRENLKPAAPYIYNAFSVYLNGAAAYQKKIVNNDTWRAPKVLLIHDSGAQPLAAFLALSFGETHLYWPELDTDSKFNLSAYVIRNNIDYVFFAGEENYDSMQSILSVLYD